NPGRFSGRVRAGGGGPRGRRGLSRGGRFLPRPPSAGALDKYRRGKRNLEAVCGEYGVVLDAAHEAGADALAAARVATAIAERHASVAALTPTELHERQIAWYAEWAVDFQRFLRKKGNTDAVVDAVWPLREPAVTTAP
ncbi:hypothetical protein ACFXP3_07675, partial [Streptomyces sp. NPDC059096]